MKQLLKADFKALVVDMIQKGRAVMVFTDGMSVCLGYADDVDGSKKIAHRVANPSGAMARNGTHDRFVGWLREVTTSAEYGAQYSANLAASQRAKDTAEKVNARRAVEKAENALNSINNILKDLVDFAPNIGDRRDVWDLREALRSAARAATSIKERNQ